MIMQLPIKFDTTVLVKYVDGTQESTAVFPTNKGVMSCTFAKINGYDANNNRVTNLVGYDGVELLKKCPCCGDEKHVTEYGYSGRLTNRKRDQSQCTMCRSRY